MANRSVLAGTPVTQCSLPYSSISAFIAYYCYLGERFWLASLILNPFIRCVTDFERNFLGSVSDGHYSIKCTNREEIFTAHRVKCSMSASYPEFIQPGIKSMQEPVLY